MSTSGDPHAARTQAEPAEDTPSADTLSRDSRASPIDVRVGSRIRLRRLQMGLTQDALAESLGVTFQQVQKYERGANRVGASRLFDLSRVLEVSIGFFFDDPLPDDAAGVTTRRRASAAIAGMASTQAGFSIDDATKAETLELVRAFNSITDPAVRARVFELVKSLAPVPGG